jgi:hypothetical protein
LMIIGNQNACCGFLFSHKSAPEKRSLNMARGAKENPQMGPVALLAIELSFTLSCDVYHSALEDTSTEYLGSARAILRQHRYSRQVYYF